MRPTCPFCCRCFATTKYVVWTKFDLGQDLSGGFCFLGAPLASVPAARLGGVDGRGRDVRRITIGGGWGRRVNYIQPMTIRSFLVSGCLVAVAFLSGCGDEAVASSGSGTPSLIGSWRRVEVGQNGAHLETIYRFPDSSKVFLTRTLTDSTGVQRALPLDTLLLSLDRTWNQFLVDKNSSHLALIARFSGQRIRLIFGEPGQLVYHRIAGEADPGHPTIGRWRSNLQCGSHTCDYDTLVFAKNGIFQNLMGPKLPEPDHRFEEQDGLIRVLQGDSVIQTMAPLFAGDSIRFVDPGFSCSMDQVCTPVAPIWLDPVP